MRETLYLQLRDAAPDAPVAHAIVAGTPGASVPVQHAPLDAVLALAAGRRIVLFVPGSDVRLAQVSVPARQPQKVLQAAPYALEDQLAEDVETLHFAIAPRAGDPHPVAIVARERMDAWLAPLRERGLKAAAVVPETLSLPPPDGRWTALAEAGRVTVRNGAWTGFSCTLADLDTYALLADPTAQVPLRLFVARDVDFDFTKLGRPIELMAGYASTLEVLVRHWHEGTSINLLQGAYSPKEEWQGLGRPWRIAAGIAAAWVLVALAAGTVGALRDARELKRLQAANAARFQELFPGASTTTDLALQAQQQLVALRGGGPSAPMLELLDSLAAALAATPGLTLQSMQFREGALYLSLSGTDLQALENLRAWYAAHPGTALSVQDTSASPEGVQVRLRLAQA